MRSNAPAATKDESARITACKESGCVACLMEGKAVVYGDYHHFKTGGKRAGHRFGCCLCKWHHVGDQNEGHDLQMMEAIHGPSLARTSKAFHLRYGSDQSIQDFEDRLIGWPMQIIKRVRNAAKSRCTRSKKTVPRSASGFS